MGIKSKIIWGLRHRQAQSFVRLMSEDTSRLDRFNFIWRDAYENVPFYDNWKKVHGLPNAIHSLGELTSWPILEKKDIMGNRDKFYRKDVLCFNESVTGGSTGEPLHFRTKAGESDVVSMNKWVGWARMGVFPDSRCFLLWGHRHGHGYGLSGRMHFFWRQVKDWMTNNLRVDATNLSQDALERDVRRLIHFRPECVIAYSASLLALVRSCRKYSEECQNLGLKAIICTAGPLSSKEREEIGTFFKAPVAMEYGSMEAGVMAYQTPMTNGRYLVFDKTHVLNTCSGGGLGDKQVLVTKLYPCYLPLIRYKIGDCILGETFDEYGSVIAFDEVLGRVGDEVDMGGGIRFHGQSFMLSAECSPKVIAYQIRVNKLRRHIVFVVQTLAPLTDDERFTLQKYSAKMSGLKFDSISIEETDKLVKAPSGKIRLVIEE